MKGVEKLAREYRARIERLADLPEDWDSYGGLPPSSAARERTAELLSKILADGTLAGELGQASVDPTPAGGLQIAWTWRSYPQAMDIEAEVQADGSITLFVEFQLSSEDARSIEVPELSVASALAALQALFRR